MSSRDERTAERRAQILQGAAIVFARNGIDGARMDDIAIESGLSKGTLYWYFDSKQEMVVALVDEVVAAQYQQLTSLLESPWSVVERLGLFVDTVAKSMDEQPILGRLGIEFYAMAVREPRVRDLISRYYDEYIATLSDLLQQGQERGELSVNDSRELALNIACLIEGLALLWAVDPTRVDLGRQVRSALTTLVR
jgi:TetR/AcrR family fatty acid metabolism transcriptional regulator